MTENQKKPEQAKHRLKEAQMRDLVKECKVRTHRLIVNGAASESVMPNGKDMDEDKLKKYDALRFLAYAYSAKGNEIAAEAAVDQIPELDFTKLSEAALVLKGKTGYEAAEKQKWILFDIILQMRQKTAEYYKSRGENEKSAQELKIRTGFN